MTPQEALDVLCWLWQENAAGILYVLWLIQTMYMLGLIVRLASREGRSRLIQVA